MFNLNAKNAGGKKAIEDAQMNHYRRIFSATSSLGITPPRPHVNKGSQRTTYFPGPEFGMVRSTFNTLKNMQRGLCDTQPPSTLKLVARISSNKNPSTHSHDEHLLELRSLCGRINRIEEGHPNDRKKNPYDPQGNPPRFFRHQPIIGEDSTLYTPEKKNLVTLDKGSKKNQNCKLRRNRASTTKSCHPP
eukprot:TRINITY_DN1248_c0_g1_i4.p1 TRINITY_DN1248_c0_g1~~TRINITY_DN1248_c0_g1_i4.p1  ORF type:complete len:190 (-),score=17.69 TRINITY_DN1248_c0_g1_i4:475-1044(-)